MNGDEPKPGDPPRRVEGAQDGPEGTSTAARAAGLFTSRREWIAVGCLLLFALAVRVVFLAEVHDQPPMHLHEWKHSDAGVFHDWASQIARNGDWLMRDPFTWPPSRFVERGLPVPPPPPESAPPAPLDPKPLYYLVLAFCFALFGYQPLVVAALQSLLGLFTLLLVHRSARRIAGPGPALAALALGCLYPTFLVYEAAQLRTTLLTFLLALSMLLSLRALRTDTPRRWAVLGLALGAGTLLYDALFVLLVPVVLACAGVHRLARARASGAAALRLDRKALQALLPFAVAAACLLAPVAAFRALPGARDRFLGAVPTPLEKNQVADPDIFLANSPELEGDGLVWGPKARPLLEAARGKRIGTRQALSMLAELHGGWIPFSWFLLKKTRFFLRWRETPQNANLYKAREYSFVLRLLPVTPLLLLPLAALGAALFLWRPPGGRRLEAILALSLVAPFVARIALICFVARLRIPTVPVLLVFAGFAAWTIGRQLKPLRPKALFALLAALAGIGLLFNPPWSFRKHTIRPADDVVAARFFAGRHRLGEARREYEKCLLHPRTDRALKAEAYRGIGAALAEEGKLGDALEALLRADHLAPGDASTSALIAWIRARERDR